jgi:hypothetical protein
VFPTIILNKHKYSEHCTLSWVFSHILEGGSIAVISCKVFYLSGVILKELLLLGEETVVMNIIVVALQLVCYDPHLHITSLDGLQYLDFIEEAPYAVANSDLKVRYSIRAHSVALCDSAKPHFQSRICHCLYEFEKFCKTGMFIVRY